MKTLRQIREEYDNNYLSLVEESTEELVFEGSVTGKEGVKTKFSRIPSSKDMPVMLIFRRVSYRVYPNKQVVSLYYSHMIDKYLSIPYGPGGNVNLSEAVILDELNEDWQDVNRKDRTAGLSQKAVNAYRREHPGSKLQTAVTEKNPTGKRAARRKSFCSRMSGMKKRLTSAKTARDPDSNINTALRRWNCEESFQVRLNELRQERLDEFAPLAAVGGAIARSAVGQAVKGAVKSGVKKLAGAALRGAGKLAGGLAGAALDTLAGANKSKEGTSGDTSPKYGGFARPAGAIKTGTSWSSASGKSDAATQAKLKAADLAQARAVTTPQKIRENKMTDLRKMIKEGVDEKEISINGKTVTLNNSMAKRILEVYDSVNTKNKRIVESMLNDDLESFKKLLTFSIRN